MAITSALTAEQRLRKQMDGVPWQVKEVSGLAHKRDFVAATAKWCALLEQHDEKKLQHQLGLLAPMSTDDKSVDKFLSSLAGEDFAFLRMAYMAILLGEPDDWGKK